MLKIGEFKYKKNTLFYIYDYGDYFFCKLNWDIDWKQFNKFQRIAIGEAFKLPKQFSTIEDLRQGTKYYTGDYRFEWR